jgi:hypothetical protein
MVTTHELESISGPGFEPGNGSMTRVPAVALIMIELSACQRMSIKCFQRRVIREKVGQKSVE